MICATSSLRKRRWILRSVGGFPFCTSAPHTAVDSVYPNAVSKLESKLAKLEQAQETMKAVNAYYRKNKTLDGCPHLSTEQIEKLKEAMSGSYRANPKPFESYQLSNNNAEIHRLKDRITALTRRKELGYVGWEFDGGRVEANTADRKSVV